ncbi:hypothetical protein BCR32DRAFT_249478 [Anaeromyces robustus]|uniref:Uncharacterized protein n=1 Tax=Anaeromyces robustus TaxID=1754192 RepID=A0A1Y1WQK5_9FUNG|nr:hypothetical protein BCR32DRAFT_249478 [Anaeromyces robustus]|eukprot:ORX75556.1 hypothetical protein BCR32DRAFT_249478 [Anaeromyces robustus]
MFYNKFGYILLLTLLINKVFCSYYLIKDNSNKTYYMFYHKDKYYVCTGLDDRIPGSCVGYPYGYTCSGGAELLTGCVDHNGKYYDKEKFGSVLDATDPFRCDIIDKIFGSGNCNPPKVSLKTNKCYNTPVNNNRITINVKLNGNYEYAVNKNGYYLTKYGWCFINAY